MENLEILWANIPEESYNEDNDEFKKEDIDSDDFIYPTLHLAFSNTFYGFNDDAGYLPSEEREKLADEKFKQYKNQFSELLGQIPANNLLPKLDFKKIDMNDKLLNIYYDCMETNPFMYKFERDFVVWKGDGKVLFLSMNKEDKELPYTIQLGGLTFEKYNEILEKYNKITV